MFFITDSVKELLDISLYSKNVKHSVTEILNHHAVVSNEVNWRLHVGFGGYRHCYTKLYLCRTSGFAAHFKLFVEESRQTGK